MVGLFHHPRQHFPQPRSRSRVTIVSPRPKITVCLGVIINARLLPDCTGVCHRWSSRTSMTPTSDDTALFVAIHHLRPPHGLVPTDRIVDDRGIRQPRFRGPPAVPDNHGQDLLQERKTMNRVQPPGDKQKNSIPSIRRAVHPLPPPRKTSVFQEELERVLLSAIYRIRFCGIRPKKGGGSVSASSKFLRVAHLSPDGHELCTCGSTCLRPQTDSAWWCGKRPFLRVPGEDRVHP